MRALWQSGDCGPTGDYMEVLIRGKAYHFTINNPWAGDSESGFGAETSLYLPLEKVAELIAFLSAHVPRETIVCAAGDGMGLNGATDPS